MDSAERVAKLEQELVEQWWANHAEHCGLECRIRRRPPAAGLSPTYSTQNGFAVSTSATLSIRLASAVMSKTLADLVQKTS
jgi:hypothetical protein